jgi:hypothetical protein
LVCIAIIIKSRWLYVLSVTYLVHGLAYRLIYALPMCIINISPGGCYLAFATIDGQICVQDCIVILNFGVTESCTFCSQFIHSYIIVDLTHLPLIFSSEKPCALFSSYIC